MACRWVDVRGRYNMCVPVRICWVVMRGGRRVGKQKGLSDMVADVHACTAVKQVKDANKNIRRTNMCEIGR